MLRRFDAVLTRAAVVGDTLHGYAAVFDQVATVPEGIEGLRATAFDAVLADQACDVRALWNHDPTLLLGRQRAGTLTLDVDGAGLGWAVQLPNTSYAEDLRELVRRGDLTGASFGFIPGESTLERTNAGHTVRWHTSVRQLVDVSPVTFPAYAAASTMLRGLHTLPAAAARPAGLRGQQALARHRARTERP